MENKKIAVVFPGQGSQYVGMGKELFQNFEIVREIFKIGSDISGFDIASACFEGPLEKLTDTRICQVCLFAVSYSCWKVLQSEFPFAPSMTAGHSLGEYSAFAAAEAFSIEDGFNLVSKRAIYMKEATEKFPGSMVAVMGKTEEEIRNLISTFDGLYISNINAPGQVVVGGRLESIKNLVAVCSKEKIKYIPLNVSGAFHTPLMEYAASNLAEEIDRTRMHTTRFPVYTNCDGNPATQPEEIRLALKRQLTFPVQWVKIAKIFVSSVDVIIELGSKKVLAGLIRRISDSITITGIEDIDSLKKTIEIMKL